MSYNNCQILQELIGIFQCEGTFRQLKAKMPLMVLQLLKYLKEVDVYTYDSLIITLQQYLYNFTSRRLEILFILMPHG